MKKLFVLPFILLLLMCSNLLAQSECDFFRLRVESLSGAARYDTLSASFLLCPETAGLESFRAIASYASDTIDFDPAALTYLWHYQGNEFTTPTFSVSLEGPGAYPFSLTVEEPRHSCRASVRLVAKVGTVPVLTGTTPSETVVCALEQFTLNGIATPVTWTSFQTSVSETVPIPEEAPEPYTSFIEFDVFEKERVIENVADIDRICVIADHVDFGQVRVELECPDGARIVLKDYGPGGVNLGEPVIWDGFTAGKGYQYCFSPAPMFGTMEQTSPAFHEYTDNAGNYYFNAMHLPAGTYTPDESLQILTGCPLNGKWTIRVSDNKLGENGFMHGWSILFHESYYPDSLIFTPEIVSKRWYRENTLLPGNPAQVSEEKEGEYIYRFQVEDNFGCRYDTTVMVKVLALPDAQIIPDLEMPVCEGDSTYLRAYPITGTGFDWVYQWMLGGNDLPGRIFDTIMAKQPATYTLMIQDTITGCIDFFDFNFNEQNCELVIPNVFTPNADGINDFFEITNLEHYPVAQMVIFNRWGKKVFEHNDYYNNWWDGQANPDGVYFYVIKYERLGKTRFLEGAVSIIR